MTDGTWLCNYAINVPGWVHPKLPAGMKLG
jgi:hypothetical protein